MSSTLEGALAFPVAQGVVLELRATVFRDNMRFETHSGEDNTWEMEREALERVWNELDRLLKKGPSQCPYSPTRKISQQ